MSKINNQSFILTALVFLFCYISLFIFSLRPPLVFDSFWHLQLGNDFLNQGLSPWIDHYSFTHYGQPVSSVPIIFQVLLAWVVSVFGENNGFVFFKQFYVLLLLFFIHVYFRQIKASWFVIFLILPFLTYFIQMRLIIRPDILSNILIIISLSLYLKARDSFANKELIATSLLLLFWVNYHSPVFGYVIVFALFLDRAIAKVINKDESYSWKTWFLWGGGIFFIGFVNPTFEHFFIALFFSSDNWKGYISEYQNSMDVYSTNKIVFLLWGLSVYLSIWSLIKKQYGFAFVTIFLGVCSYYIARIITPVAIVNFCVLAFFLSQITPKKVASMRLSSLVKTMVITVAISLSLLAYYHAIRDARFVLQTMDNNSNKRYPIQLSDYLKNYHDGGNILNSLTMGGYLIHKLSPDFKVHIDGRTNILYSLDYYKHHRKVYNNSTILSQEVEHYNIQYLVYRSSIAALNFSKTIKNRTLNFADDGFLLFAKSNTPIAFPIASKLTILPMCWSDQLMVPIQKEIELSNKLFANKSYTVKQLLLAIDNYRLNGKNSTFFNTLDEKSLSSDIVRRLMGYLALHDLNYLSAYHLFGGIKDSYTYDTLMFAYSMAKLKKGKDVEILLLNFIDRKTQLKNDPLSLYDIAVIVEILELFQKDNKLEKFSLKDIEIFKNKLKKEKFNNDLPLTTFMPNQDACKVFFGL